MKKTTSKVAHNQPHFFLKYCQPAQNQPTFHILFHKNGSLHDFYIMTLDSGLVTITHDSTFIPGDITETSCKQFQLLLDNWDRNEPKVYLENSRNPPGKSVLSLIEFTAFIQKLKKLNDEKTNEYTAWTSTLRAAAYSTAGGVTAGMIVADIFGCLGK